MKTFMAVLLLAPMSVSAGSMYKCSGEDGVVSFQNLPCSGQQSEKMAIPTNSTSGYSDSSPVAPAQPSSTQKAWSDYQQKNQASQQKYRARLEEIDQENCQYYKDRLADTKDRWGKIKRSGYKQWEKDQWESRITSRERDVARECD